MTTTAVDGFSFDRWLDFFKCVKRDPQRFLDAMTTSSIPKWKGVDAELWQHQIELRKKIARKFDDPHRWIWSNDYLQLASDQHTAEMVASHFPAGCTVVDIGCGGGSDAIALAQARSVVALDKSEFACHLTECNARLQNEDSLKNLNVRHGIAEELKTEHGAFLHIDPDRRQDGVRSVQMKWHSPDLDTVRRLVNESAGGSIKLAPACSDDHSIFGKDITRQWITTDHHVVQQRWWWGTSPSLNCSVWISSHSKAKGWVHEFIQELDKTNATAPIASSAKDIRPGMFIGDGDPALRASNCQSRYVAQEACALIGNSSGFFLSDVPLTLPLIRWHKITSVLPMDAKRIRKFIRDRELDGIELKSRNVRSIPADLAKMSTQKGRLRVPVFVFSVENSHVAVIAEETL